MSAIDTTSSATRVQDDPAAILKRLESPQRERLAELARGQHVQATITLLGWTDVCPALATAGADGHDKINDLGRRVAELLSTDPHQEQT